MPKGERLKQLSAFALLFFVVVACGEVSSPVSSTTLKSPDGKFELTAPEGWTANGPLDSDEIIKAKNISGDMVVLVSFESKVDLADDITLDKYTDIGRNNLVTKGVGSDLTKPESLTVNESEARQFEAKVKSENSKTICLVTKIEAPERFYSINACTLPSKYDENKTDSFRLAGFNDSSPPSH